MHANIINMVVFLGNASTVLWAVEIGNHCRNCFGCIRYFLLVCLLETGPIRRQV